MSKRDERQMRTMEPAGSGSGAVEEVAVPPRDEVDAGCDAVGRRGFLQLGLLGGAAATLGVGGVEPAQGQKKSKQSKSAGGEGGASPGGKQFPYATQPVDLTTDTETWIEPWVWRPADWPGQDLALNIVENENPGPIVGFGNLPGSVAASSSQLYANNLVSFLTHLVQDGEVKLDLEDEVVRGPLVCHEGEIMNDRVREALK